MNDLNLNAKQAMAVRPSAMIPLLALLLTARLLVAHGEAPNNSWKRVDRPPRFRAAGPELKPAATVDSPTQRQHRWHRPHIVETLDSGGGPVPGAEAGTNSIQHIHSGSKRFVPVTKSASAGPNVGLARIRSDYADRLDPIAVANRGIALRGEMSHLLGLRQRLVEQIQATKQDLETIHKRQHTAQLEEAPASETVDALVKTILAQQGIVPDQLSKQNPRTTAAKLSVGKASIDATSPVPPDLSAKTLGELVRAEVQNALRNATLQKQSKPAVDGKKTEKAEFKSNHSAPTLNQRNQGEAAVREFIRAQLEFNTRVTSQLKRILKRENEARDDDS